MKKRSCIKLTTEVKDSPIHRYNLRPRKTTEEVELIESPSKIRRIDVRFEKSQRRMIKWRDRLEKEKKDITSAEVSHEVSEHDAASLLMYLNWNPTMTVSQFLQSKLPVLMVNRDKEKKTETYQDRAHPRSPKFIKHWEGFMDGVRTASRNIPTRYKMPFFSGIDPTFVLKTEIPDVQGKIRDICHYIEKIYSEVLEMPISLCGEMHPDFVGQPDFYLVSEGTALGFIEAKNPFILPHDKDIRTEEEQHRCWSIIKQVYGYLAFNRLRYGVLSSYNITYFLYRPEAGTLWISPGIKPDSTDPTLLQCLFYWCELALKDEELPVDASIESPIRKEEDDDTEEAEDEDDEYKPVSPTTKSSTTTSDDDGAAPILSKLTNSRRFIGRGASGKVFVVNNDSIAIKVVDKNNNPEGEICLRQEVLAYTKMSSLRLSFVPKFYFSKSRFGLHFLGIEFIDGSDCNEETFRVIQIKLSKRLKILRKHGIILGDVRKENIIMLNDGSDFKIIDFGICEIR